jgi:hypothetical protein
MFRKSLRRQDRRRAAEGEKACPLSVTQKELLQGFCRNVKQAREKLRKRGLLRDKREKFPVERHGIVRETADGQENQKKHAGRRNCKRK